ncbi:MAG TPA: hypothetical protein V6D47_06875 [Oscillatoriaceae cyanobacterium]
MSLAELVHSYAEASTEERRRLLSAIAEHLPAPEFLWHPIAVEALQGDDAELRLAALELLAYAPQSWDLILVAALTRAEADFQVAALDTLAALASLDETLRDAYAALEELPGWLPEAAARWREHWGALASTDWLAARLELLEREITGLRAHADSSESARHEAEARAAALEAERDLVRTSSIARERALAAEVETAAATAREERQALQEAFRDLEGRHGRRMKLAGAIAAVLVLFAAGGGWMWGSRSPVSAQEPIVQPARAPVDQAAAEARGYDDALGVIAARATELEHTGYYYPALTLWQCYAQAAKDPAAVKAADTHADALLAKIHTAVVTHAPVRLAVPHKPAPPIDSATLIPAQVRAKF